jgi:hypothetical protein
MASIQTTLRQNCRNTPQIVTAVEFAAGIPLGTTRVRGGGPDVLYAKSRSKLDRLQEAVKCVQGWLRDDQVRPGHIVLLTALSLENSSVHNLAAQIGLTYKKWQADWDRMAEFPRCLAASTIEEFRGLESPFVVLCDIGEEGSMLREDLYIGLTRANFAVFVECTDEARIALVTKSLAKLAT